jgi:hypothetical protein
MDHRDIAALRGAWYKRLDERAMTALVEVLCTEEDVGVDAHGYATEDVVVRIEWEVCPTCDGRGSHVNPSIDAHGLTAEDFDADPDFAQDYLSGKYDVACAECGGERVVPVVAEDDPNKERVWERQAIMAQMAREDAIALRMGW